MSQAPRRQSIKSAPSNGVNSAAATDSGFFSTVAHFALGAVSQAQKGVNAAGGIVVSHLDAVGLKDKVEAAEHMVKKVAQRGRNEANKAANKARRLANRAFEFDGDESYNVEYDLLLSMSGAIEKSIAAYGNHSPMFSLPAGSTFVYKVRVKKLDINFAIREVREGEAPFVIEPFTRYSADAVIQGTIEPVDRPRTINLFFDNSLAFQGKTVAYWVSFGENVSLTDDQSNAARTKEFTAAEEGPSD
jgi:hypothetical protein